MFELLKAGGFLMWPILLASIIALAIVIERFFALRKRKVSPPGLLHEVYDSMENGKLDNEKIQALEQQSPLGQILAAGLKNHDQHRIVIKEAIEQQGTYVVSDMQRYLSTLGTIASITPLLGLLGTVIGMIKVFSVITTFGVGDPHILSQGISEALITTAAGLFVGIPSLMFYRYFCGYINALAINMEQQSLSFIKVLKRLN